MQWNACLNLIHEYSLNWCQTNEPIYAPADIHNHN